MPSDRPLKIEVGLRLRPRHTGGGAAARGARDRLAVLYEIAFLLGPGWMMQADIEGPIYVADRADDLTPGMLFTVRSDDVLADMSKWIDRAQIADYMSRDWPSIA